MRRTLLVASVLLAAIASPLAAQTPRPTRASALAQLTRAQGQLDSGAVREAQREFHAVVGYGSMLSREERAAAHFGRAVTTHELLRSLESERLPAGTVDSALADYLNARTLDSTRYHAAALRNAALLSRLAGRSDVAAAQYEQAARAGTGKERAADLVRAARSYTTAPSGDPRVLALYRAALAADPGSADAILALALRRPGAALAADVATLRTLMRDETLAPEVSRAALRALGELRDLGEDDARQLLVLYVDANVRAEASPDLVRGWQLATLDSIGARQPTLRAGLTPLVAAYRGDPPARARGSALPEWWRRSGAKASWFAMLRTLGSWHERAGDLALAEHYYRGALDYPGPMMDAGVDLGALLPLVLLYDARATRDSTARQELEGLLDFAFGGKSAAYAREAWPQIRQFHLSLGAYYARRRQWAGTPRGAVFQLERMHEMTTRLRQQGQTVVDPPQLLEQLFEGYLAMDRPADAARLLPAIRAANEATGREDTSNALRARLARRGAG
ncbi:MAG TPA: hypothetical protein VEA99_11495 [Gemmatimonadaceae bacterium]|nr:hypothetical protein [Gemmatimonadaceae bacterium]